jgi:hypothetical protein
MMIAPARTPTTTAERAARRSAQACTDADDFADGITAEQKADAPASSLLVDCMSALPALRRRVTAVTLRV